MLDTRRLVRPINNSDSWTSGANSKEFEIRTVSVLVFERHPTAPLSLVLDSFQPEEPPLRGARDTYVKTC